MILTIPMQLEAAKKEVPVEFSKIQGSQFNIIKNNSEQKEKPLAGISLKMACGSKTN